MQTKPQQWFRDQQTAAREETQHAIDLAMNEATAAPKAIEFALSSSQRVRNIAIEVRRDQYSPKRTQQDLKALRSLGKR